MKFPSKLLQYNHHTLSTLLKCKMQNYRKLCQRSAAKFWQNFVNSEPIFTIFNHCEENV